MEPTKELIDDLYRERVLRARRVPIEQKLLAGAELFEGACARMMAGVRMQYPDADEAEVRAIFHRRLELVRRLHEVRR
jgi:hypothetical protein